MSQKFLLDTDVVHADETAIQRQQRVDGYDEWNMAYLRRFYHARAPVIFASFDDVRISLYIQWRTLHMEHYADFPDSALTKMEYHLNEYLQLNKSMQLNPYKSDFYGQAELELADIQTELFERNAARKAES